MMCWALSGCARADTVLRALGKEEMESQLASGTTLQVFPWNLVLPPLALPQEKPRPREREFCIFSL